MYPVNHYIPREDVFSRNYDVDHIIPRSLLFDDSLANKTLTTRKFNEWKGNRTAIEAIRDHYGENSEEYAQYKSIVEDLYKRKKISRAKYERLLMTASEIPDGFIERDLRNTQYIAKKAYEILSAITRTITPTVGSITARLRSDWGLENLIEEINWPRFQQLGLTYEERDKDQRIIRRIKEWSKREDQRHHALDAIIVAFTKKGIVQYLNHINASRDEDHPHHIVIRNLQQKFTTTEPGKGRRFRPPIPSGFRNHVKQILEGILVSYKTRNKVVTPRKNLIRVRRGHPRAQIIGKKAYIIQHTLTPRGQLHNETIYGDRPMQIIEKKIDKTFDAEFIQQHVVDPRIRAVLLQRLQQYDNDPRKAFAGRNTPARNPIYIDPIQQIPIGDRVKVRIPHDNYTVRKEVSAWLGSSSPKDAIKKIQKVVSPTTRDILMRRIEEYNGNPKEAFTNIDRNPIWFNEKAGISIKRVRITAGVRKAYPLHQRKNHRNEIITDAEGRPLPVDFVNLGNNHHVAIYEDPDGQWHEQVVSFMEAVRRKMNGEPIVNTTYNAAKGWEFLFTIKQNEMFLFPSPDGSFQPTEWTPEDLMNPNHYAQIAPYLFRVQQISSRDYWFNHHWRTKVAQSSDRNIKDHFFHRITSLDRLRGIVKVRLDHTGRIVHVGEY